MAGLTRYLKDKEKKNKEGQAALTETNYAQIRHYDKYHHTGYEPQEELREIQNMKEF